MPQLTMRDALSLQGVRILSDGRLVAEPRFARAGIQVYGGHEVGKPEQATVRLYRSPEAVFDKAAMASFCHRAITNDHPSDGVTTENFRDLVVGFTGEQVTRDGDYVRIPMMLADAGSIEDVQAGKVELSAGYTCDVDWTPGVTPSGEPFDGQMRNIRGNHVAIVDRARAGSECRIGDDARQSNGSPPASNPAIPYPQNGAPTMADHAIRMVTVDGLTVPVTDQGAQVIEKLQNQLRDSAASLSAIETRLRDAEAAHTAALQARDGQLAALRAEAGRVAEAHDQELATLRTSHQQALDAAQGEVAAIRAQIPDAAALEAIIDQRLAVANDAALLIGDGFNPRGLSLDEMRRRAVEARMGAAAVADRSADYVGACFDTLVAQARAAAPKAPDHLARAIAAGAGATQAADSLPANIAARDAYHARLRQGWTNNPAQEAR